MNNKQYFAGFYKLFTPKLINSSNPSPSPLSLPISHLPEKSRTRRPLATAYSLMCAWGPRGGGSRRESEEICCQSKGTASGWLCSSLAFSHLFIALRVGGNQGAYSSLSLQPTLAHALLSAIQTLLSQHKKPLAQKKNNLERLRPLQKINNN